jgi:hypothetical protein
MLTADFLERKAAEYAMLKSELERYEKYEKQIKGLEQRNTMKNLEKAIQ